MESCEKSANNHSRNPEKNIEKMKFEIKLGRVEKHWECKKEHCKPVRQPREKPWEKIREGRQENLRNILLKKYVEQLLHKFRKTIEKHIHRHCRRNILIILEESPRVSVKTIQGKPVEEIPGSTPARTP